MTFPIAQLIYKPGNKTLAAYANSTGGRDRFTVPLPKILPLTREQSRKNDPVKPGLKSGAQSRAQSGKILLVLSDSPLSSNEIAHILDMPSKSEGGTQTLHQSIAEGFVD